VAPDAWPGGARWTANATASRAAAKEFRSVAQRVVYASSSAGCRWLPQREAAAEAAGWRVQART